MIAYEAIALGWETDSADEPPVNCQLGDVGDLMAVGNPEEEM